MPMTKETLEMNKKEIVELTWIAAQRFHEYTMAKNSNIDTKQRKLYLYQPGWVQSWVITEENFNKLWEPLGHMSRYDGEIPWPLRHMINELIKSYDEWFADELKYYFETDKKKYEEKLKKTIDNAISDMDNFLALSLEAAFDYDHEWEKYEDRLDEWFAPHKNALDKIMAVVKEFVPEKDLLQYACDFLTEEVWTPKQEKLMDIIGEAVIVSMEEWREKCLLKKT